MSQLRDGMEKVRKAFEDTRPREGENGFDYYDRIRDGFGYGKPGGAWSPAHTTLQCTIRGDLAYYASQPEVVRMADCTHERVHVAACEKARADLVGGYEAWMSTASNYRQNELDAYGAGMRVLDDWMNTHGCR